MPKINNMQEASVAKIQVLYDVEKQLEKALPKLEEAASDPELKEGFSSHLEETMNHSARLEKVFELIDSPVKKLESEAIKGIIKDGKWVVDVDAPPETKDKMLAGAARYAEHYEMAGYMTAIAEADELGLIEVSGILASTLEEEEAADEKLALALEKT